MVVVVVVTVMIVVVVLDVDMAVLDDVGVERHVVISVVVDVLMK